MLVGVVYAIITNVPNAITTSEEFELVAVAFVAIIIGIAGAAWSFHKASVADSQSVG